MTNLLELPERTRRGAGQMLAGQDRSRDRTPPAVVLEAIGGLLGPG